MDDIHKARPNIIIFIWKGTDIALLPVKEIFLESGKPISKQKMLLSFCLNTFNNKLRKARIVLALVVKEHDLISHTISDVVKELLATYSDLTHTELLNTLPPLRFIQHQIDFILDSNLRNLPHYIRNHKDHELL